MDSIEIVKSFLAALERADLEAAKALLDENVEYQNVPLPPDHGKEAVLKTLQRFAVIADQFQVIMKNIASSDGGVVLTERIDILSGEGVRLEFWVCGTFEVKNGKITLWRDYFDFATVATQIAKSFPGFLARSVARLFNR